MLWSLHNSFAHWLEKKLVVPGPLTLISEDCWAGEFYRTLKRPYETPLVGVFIPSPDYLTFLENLRQPDAFDLRPSNAVLDPVCPPGETPYAHIGFLHYPSYEDALEKFERRKKRICWERLYYKIDFGKPGYTQRDVERWNALKLEPAVAFLPAHTSLDLSNVHRGWPIKDWTISGTSMFHMTRREFDFYHWLRTGQLRKSRIISALNFLFFDPWMFKRIHNGIRRRLGLKNADETSQPNS